LADQNWYKIGDVEDFKIPPLREITINNIQIALSYQNDKFGAISNICNHVGGPLGQGCLDGEYIVCPWHNWKFHRTKGFGEPGFEQDKVPQYELKIEDGVLYINTESITTRHKTPHTPHPLARKIKREEGKIRVVGISTTIMDQKILDIQRQTNFLKLQ